MYLKVEVVAGAKKEIVKKLSNDSFAVSVRQEAEQNQANKRVLEIVRAQFGDSRVITKIVSGHRSPSKIISVDIVDLS